jgi:hypothetical protein
MKRPPITPGPLHAFRLASPDYAPTFGIYATDDPNGETIIRTSGEHAAEMADAIAALPCILDAVQRTIERWTDDPDDLETMDKGIEELKAALLKAGYTP